MNRFYFALIGFALGMFIILALRDHIPALQEIKYAYIDIDTIIQDISDHMALEEAKADELKAKIEEYRKQFLEKVREYSDVHGVVIISEPKVIAGMPDITNEFLFKKNE